MGTFRAVFLLCSLLAPSQGGIMPLVTKMDADDIKHSVAKRDLQKAQGLLGGGLLSGLLGKGGPVESLLGKEGALGSLLGKEGALGSLLGKEGAVDSLLGKDGVVGGLLDKDGAVGSLLGKDGVVGGLLGKEGAVGSLLGKDGVVGGLLDKDGVVGSLLGKDGILDGLLGKDGLLDGLLGKDGLVDSLLDAVLQLLTGKGGLLGKDGLVGSLLGGDDEDLTGPKILKNNIPKLSLHSMPGFGHRMGFNSQLLVQSTSEEGKDLCMQVEADADVTIQDKWGAPQNDKDCETGDINIRVRPDVPLLDQPLKKLLGDFLREVGCNIINTRLNAVSSLLNSGTPLPLGALGDLPPFSILSSDAIRVDLNLLTEGKEGSVVTSAQGPSLAATLQLTTGRPPRLSLSQNVLSALLKPIQGKGAFNLNITDSMVPNKALLSMAALGPLIPQLSRILPSNLPLELRLRVASEPVVAVRDGKATVTLKASIDIFSPALQSTQRPLFSLDADIVLNVTPSVSNGKLQTSLALDSINLTGAPLRLDVVSVSSLTEWLKKILGAAFVPTVNDALQVSVGLPTILNTTLGNAQVDITEADDFPDQDTLKNSCPEGLRTLLPV